MKSCLWVVDCTYLREGNLEMYINLGIEWLVWEKTWMKAFTIVHV